MPDDTQIVEAAVPVAEAVVDNEIVSRLEAAKSDLEALVVASENKLALFKTRVIAMLNAGVSGSEIKRLVENDDTLGMSDNAFELVCENLKPRVNGASPNPTVMAGEDNVPASLSWNSIFGG